MKKQKVSSYETAFSQFVQNYYWPDVKVERGERLLTKWFNQTLELKQTIKNKSTKTEYDLNLLGAFQLFEDAISQELYDIKFKESRQFRELEELDRLEEMNYQTFS